MASQSGDDLYSDDSGHDLSVHESDAFSPTDGYFQPSDNDGHSPAAEGSGGGPREASHAVPHVPDVMVEDPTLSEPRSAKEVEAAHDGQQNSGGTETAPEAQDETSSHTHQVDGTDRLQSSRRQSNEASVGSNYVPNLAISDTASARQPLQASFESVTRFQSPGRLLPAQIIDAPPAYSSARSVNYGTLEPALQEIPSRSSTREEYTVADENEPLLSPQRQLNDSVIENVRPTSKSSTSKTASRICLAMIIILTTTLSSLITAAVILHPAAPKTEFIDREPISGPSPEAPLLWKPLPALNCRNTPYRLSEVSYTVSLVRESTLNIVEEGWSNDARSTDGRDVTVFGEVIIRTAPPSAGASVTLDGFTNDPRIKPRLNIRSQTYYLSGPSPVLNWADAAGSPCYQGRIILWLPAGSVFESTAIITDHFDINIRNGLNISNPGGFIATLSNGDVTAPGVMDAVGGPVSPYRIQAPDCIMISGLGNIRGWFPLYNRLKLLSVFGDVSALIGLKSVDLLTDSSAQLESSSRRGNVNITAVPPQKDSSGRKDGKLPLRDYASIIHTRMGNITAKIPIGSRTEFETVSGHTDADLQPILGYKSRDWNRNPWLNTLSENGNTRIRVREPIWTDAIKFPGNDYPFLVASRNDAFIQGSGSKSIGQLLPFHSALQWKYTNAITKIVTENEPWANFESRHISSEGELQLTYPDSWTGTINWQGTDTKGMSLLADSVTVLRQWGSMIKHLEARRGKGRSIVNIDSRGGFAILAIGREITKNNSDLFR